MSKLWQKASLDASAQGQGLGLHPDIESFLSSLSVDSRLLPEDLECSIAHASMLGARGILPADQAKAITAELAAMLEAAKAGKLPIDRESEDIHSFIEAELTRRLGEAGKAVHAGRSRNDQVAVAFRLHALRAFGSTAALVLEAMEAILALAKANAETLMPGYTHLQRAQPVTLAHHLLAWAAALERDYDRLLAGRARADECPLGSGALAGSGLPTDREATALSLGFARPSRNSMDAVADRDFCVDYASACSSIAMHLSRACEDIVLWTSTEYSFARLSDAASTGSSIMPQKHNPDPAELIRGKSARIFGGLQALLVLQKALPYAYNRDLQEDKELFFDLEDTAEGMLKAFAVLVSSLAPDRARMRTAVDEGFLEATDVAEYLVEKGLPFRTAYQAAKELVGLALATGRRLSELSDAEVARVRQAFAAPDFDAEELRTYLEPWACALRRKQTGGPAPEAVMGEIARLEAFAASAREAL